MNTDKIDAEIVRFNTELKAARCRVTIERRHSRLCLRGTFPPKPGTDKTAPHTQRLLLGLIYATPAGLRAVRKKAFIISEQLNEGSFSWSEWLEPDKGSQTVIERQLTWPVDDN